MADNKTRMRTNRPIELGAPDSNVFVPRLAKIVDIQDKGPKEKLFRFEFNDGLPLGHRPGQFAQVSIAGVGEAPISISSAPSDFEGSKQFEMCIRRVGNVTNILHQLSPGRVVGIRGPYGTSFPIEDFYGRDIVMLAGGIGIVPLRSLIREVLYHQRDKFGRVFILFGARTMEDLIFKNEWEEQWGKRDDVELKVSIDAPQEGWNGRVCMITGLIPEIRIEALKTVACLCGPPIMYRFVLRELRKKRVPVRNTYLSLERMMKCGIGMCGHCQMEEIFVCQDGPVFNLTDVKDVSEYLD